MYCFHKRDFQLKIFHRFPQEFSSLYSVQSSPAACHIACQLTCIFLCKFCVCQVPDIYQKYTCQCLLCWTPKLYLGHVWFSMVSNIFKIGYGYDKEMTIHKQVCLHPLKLHTRCWACMEEMGIFTKGGVLFTKAWTMRSPWFLHWRDGALRVV